MTPEHSTAHEQSWRARAPEQRLQMSRSSWTGLYAREVPRTDSAARVVRKLCTLYNVALLAKDHKGSDQINCPTSKFTAYKPNFWPPFDNQLLHHHISTSKRVWSSCSSTIWLSYTSQLKFLQLSSFCDDHFNESVNTENSPNPADFMTEFATI